MATPTGVRTCDDLKDATKLAQLREEIGSQLDQLEGCFSSVLANATSEASFLAPKEEFNNRVVSEDSSMAAISKHVKEAEKRITEIKEGRDEDKLALQLESSQGVETRASKAELLSVRLKQLDRKASKAKKCGRISKGS